MNCTINYTNNNKFIHLTTQFACQRCQPAECAALSACPALPLGTESGTHTVARHVTLFSPHTQFQNESNSPQWPAKRLPVGRVELGIHFASKTLSVYTVQRERNGERNAASSGCREEEFQFFYLAWHLKKIQFKNNNSNYNCNNSIQFINNNLTTTTNESRQEINEIG